MTNGSEQTKPSDAPQNGDPVLNKIRYVQYAIEKLGFPLLIVLVLSFLLWKKTEQFNHKLDRIIRNERAIMQKLEIPIIVGEDKWDEK